MRLQDVHVDSLATSTRLTEFYDRQAIPPLEVIAALSAAKIKFMLVGTHAIGGWMRKPRATLAVEVLVSVKQHGTAARLLLSKFPDLVEKTHLRHIRLGRLDSEQFSVHVIKPQEPLQRMAFKHAYFVHSQKPAYMIPSLELALAMKYASFTSLPWSDPDKYQEVHDFHADGKRESRGGLRETRGTWGG
jgi:hypothetical protein